MVKLIFGKDQPFVWFTWPIIVGLFWIPSFILNTSSDAPESYIGLISPFIVALSKTKWLAVLITLLFVIIQSYSLKYITSKHDLIKSNTFYVPFIYGLTISIFQYDIVLNPFLITYTLLLFAINKLLELGKEGKSKLIVFEASFLIGISAVFYFPMIYFIFIVWIALFLFKSFELREWLQPLIGLSIPFLYFFAYWFWVDSFNEEIINFSNQLTSFSFFEESRVSTTANISRFWIVLVIGLSSNSYFSNLRSNIMRKKYSHLLFVWVVFICLIATLFSNLPLTSFFICVSLLTTTFYTVMVTGTSKRFLPNIIAISGIVLIIVNYFIVAYYL